MSPQNPKDPDALSLRPSKHAGGDKPDFSNVRSHADTVPGGRGGGGGPGTPDFSNVRSDADTVPAGGPAAGMQTYTVRKGDTLSAIAQHHYGKASRWHAIFDANRDQLDDPDLIHPGQVLKLPAID
ncbi:LysM peptidoglycan-binding domain-containing protein [Cognatiluteimonas weifangensis]|uniref:LysM peptidoglycan-binding domain-containing protein n=1 Tax=Cognatiluteimonas weifangensis TaxID=2303539 RepID=A0A372DPG0_9GAMM|nr:LysM peptidoglycan-binding domain-containing protein [Luteimonas weifangensis]